MSEEYDADLSSSIESIPEQSPAENIEIEIVEEKEPPKEKPKKEKKKRKPMTPEHKAKLLEGLKKAREKSNLMRKKRSEAKKITKRKEDEEVDRILHENLLSKGKKEDDKDKEIARLKKKLESLTLQDVIKKPNKKVERVPTPTPELEPEPEPEPEPVKLEIIKEDKVLEVITPTQTIKKRICRGRKKKGKY
tara:strand:+ start:830 stop:1405 length:576 start_codon:yes stop_codon:yes gene_type:complete